jgi:hypothetical protein
MSPNASLLEEILNVTPQHSSKNQTHECHQARYRHRPEKRKLVIESIAIHKIHAKVPGDECQRRKEDCHDGQDHHEVVRFRANGVENEGGDIGGGGVHLFECLDHRSGRGSVVQRQRSLEIVDLHAMIEDVTKISVC